MNRGNGTHPTSRAATPRAADAPPRPPMPRRRPETLGDFTITPRTLRIVAWAVPVGALGAGAAWVLIKLIGLITQVVFFGRWTAELISPGQGSHPWWLVLLAPVVGGLVVGVMARWGSEKIRGHGMPEAIEAILIKGSRVEPRVAVLKPTSAAISIGTGGPFGAEGPIIMTGGAVGSVLAQHLHLSADERKALMVAGSAAGMTATFNAPLASIMLAVELLLFEWRPRSLLPVVTAVVVATVLRWPLLGYQPIFPVDGSSWHIGLPADGLAVVAGAVGGLLAVVVTTLVYFSEDTFNLLGGFRVRTPWGPRVVRLHWMWWPAIGGLIIGVGGLFEPHALGVGYDVIGQLLHGQAGLSLIVGILIVKSLIWSLSLGSGTSGGVLAPMFLIGSALGALEGFVLPTVGPGFWALVGLTAVVGGVMRCPLTGIVFSLELTHAWPALFPLIIASASAYAVSALILRRSVLTEKIARRGYHLSREYSVDPLEVVFVDEVMHPSPISVGPGESLAAAAAGCRAPVPRPHRDRHASETGSAEPVAAPQRLAPVVDADRRLLGVVWERHLDDDAEGTVEDVMTDAPLVVPGDDNLRAVRERFAVEGVAAAPVVDPDGGLVGLLVVEHLLDGHLYAVSENAHRERFLDRGRAGRRGDDAPSDVGGRTVSLSSGDEEPRVDDVDEQPAGRAP